MVDLKPTNVSQADADEEVDDDQSDEPRATDEFEHLQVRKPLSFTWSSAANAFQ